MNEERDARTKQILSHIDDTRVQTVLDVRGINLDYLEDDNLSEDAQISAIGQQLWKLTVAEFNNVNLDISRILEIDEVEELTVKYRARADELWKAATRNINKEANQIANVMVPKADALHSDSKQAQYEKMSQKIEAASVALASSVAQHQTDLRERLRREFYAEAPHVRREVRNALVMEVVSDGVVANGRLIAPSSVNEAQKAIVDLGKVVARRDLEGDDLDILLAASRRPSPHP